MQRLTLICAEGVNEMFKHTGIIRRIDDVGRLVIPKEIRRKFRIYDGDPIEIGEDGDFIALRKYSALELDGENVQRILRSFIKTTSHPVILCSGTNVMQAYGVSMKTPDSLSSELCDDLRKSDKDYLGYEITVESRHKVAALEKINICKSLEGALIIPRISYGKQITEADRECLKLCANAITEFLS